MKKSNTKSRKLGVHIAAIAAVSSLAAYALAAPDYDRIRKDINVMIGIVKSSSENATDCQNCNVRVTGHYLAEQGVVFNVAPETSGYRFATRSDGFEDDIAIFADGMASIPHFVQDILTDVQIGLESDEFTKSIQIMTDNNELDIDSREAKHALREARAGIREAIRELRELEIEAIHADTDELATLEMKEAEIEKEVAKLEAKEEEIKVVLTGSMEKRNRERQARKEKREQERKERFEVMETLVLNTFCDYSSTMRSLPSNERVSIIVKKDEDDSNIYVFEQSKLKNCDSTKSNVRDHALSYAF